LWAVFKVTLGCLPLLLAKGAAKWCRHRITPSPICQAIEFHRPLRTTPVLERVHALVRGVAAKWDRDRAMAPDIAAVRDLIRDGALHDAVAADLA
jgi:hypothetical protein